MRRAARARWRVRRAAGDRKAAAEEALSPDGRAARDRKAVASETLRPDQEATAKESQEVQKEASGSCSFQ